MPLQLSTSNCTAAQSDNFSEFKQPLVSAIMHSEVALGGLLVACLPLDPRFAGSSYVVDLRCVNIPFEL
jgi:hypothetical protein